MNLFSTNHRYSISSTNVRKTGTCKIKHEFYLSLRQIDFAVKLKSNFKIEENSYSSTKFSTVRLVVLMTGEANDGVLGQKS